MSRRHFDYFHPRYGTLSVTAGWDRPLGGFFLTVEQRGAVTSEGETTYLFSNLDSQTFLPGMDSEEVMIRLDDLRAVLEYHQIPTPLHFFGDLIEDRLVNCGSLKQIYTLF